MGVIPSELDRTLEVFFYSWANDNPYIEAHTSGSTGRPKTIFLSKADMKISALATCRKFDINSGSTLHLCLSTSYIAGKMMLVRSYVSGASVISEIPSNNPLKNDPCRIIDLTAIVPSQIEGLLQSPFFNKVKNIIVGGAPMSHYQESLLINSGKHAFATYGMTETCSHVALRHVGSDRYNAMPGIEFSVDERECLIINAPGYSFRQLTTNDLVELISPTEFRWLGRYDNVINSGGIKIFPEEIEKALKEHLPVTEFYISSRKSKKWGEEPLIVVSEKESEDISDEELLKLCKEIIMSVKAPKSVIRLKTILYTANGKLFRQKF